jgi:hypothetical protein
MLRHYEKRKRVIINGAFAPELSLGFVEKFTAQNQVVINLNG